MYLGIGNESEQASYVYSLSNLLDKKKKEVELLEKKLAMEKRAYRDLLKVEEKYKSEWRTNIRDKTAYDRRMAKIVVDHEMNDEEINEYKEEKWCYWYNPWNDGRDCTGVWFTVWIDFFRVNGKTIIYHWQERDI